MTDSIAILADDLTGANDTGVQFSRLGGTVLVFVSMERMPASIDNRWDVLVVNTGTRNLSPAAAEIRVAEAMGHLRRLGVPLIYKKIDSTLRGNVLAELKALLDTGVPDAILAPAFPLNGRTVERGILKVNGVPVHQTEAGHDGLSPVASGDLVAMLDGAFPGGVGTIGLEVIAQGAAAVRGELHRLRGAGRKVFVCDARTQEDLAHLSRSLRGDLPGPVLVGSAGLARELAADMLAGKSPHGVPRGCERVLVVAGSRSAVTARQVDRLRSAGIAGHVVIDAALVDGAWDEARREAERAALCDDLAAQAEAADAASTTWLVTLGADDGTTPPEQFHERSERLNALLGAAVAEAERRWPGTGLVLTGGDVAAAAISALGAEGIELGAEVLPGIPSGTLTGGAHAGVSLVTKAGAFGPDDALLLATQALLGR